MKSVLFLLVVFISGACVAQVDSLRQKLSGSNGKEKVKLLNRLTALDTVNFRAYHTQAMTLAKKINDPSGEVHALCAMGDHYYDLGNYSAAYPYYSKAISASGKYKLPYDLIMCLDKAAATKEADQKYPEALNLYNEAVAESRKLNDKNETMVALERVGLFLRDQREDSIALERFHEQLQIAKELNDSAAMYISLNNIGTVYHIRGDFENCLQYYDESLRIVKKMGNDSIAAISLLNTGLIYKEQANYPEALKRLLEALRYLETRGPSKSLGSCYAAVGSTYQKFEETNNALFYHYKSLEVRKIIQNKKSISMSYTNIGETYIAQGKYDSALRNINRSIELKEEVGDKGLLASSIDLLGELYFQMKNYELAEKYFLNSMELRKEITDPNGKATTLNKLGNLYFEWKKYDLALLQLEEGRKIAMATGTRKILLTNYEITIRVLKATGKSDEAIRFYDEYIALNEEILSVEKNKAIRELQIKYDLDKKDHQIELMKEKDKSQAAIVSQQSTQINSLIVVAFLLIVIFALAFKAYRSGAKSNKQNKVIIAQKQMMIEQKQIVMKELHHRVKNNLQVLSSLLNLQQQRMGDVQTKEAIKAVGHRMNAMLLIHQDLYGESADSLVDMKAYLEKLVDNLLFSFDYSKDKMKVNFDAEPITLDADKALSLGFICNELISNSFKHAFSETTHPELMITLKKNSPENLLFTIADNGKGMQVEKDIEKNNSFGLRLINMFTKDLKGSVTIVSDQRGSRFEFIIPINN